MLALACLPFQYEAQHSQPEWLQRQLRAGIAQAGLWFAPDDFGRAMHTLNWTYAYLLDNRRL